MTRFLYILLIVVVVVSCSGNNPVRYLKPVVRDSFSSFIIEYSLQPHDSFPLHYLVHPDTLPNSKEYSYSFVTNDGDTLVWEEGVIRE